MTVFRLADNVWELGRVLLMCRTLVGKGTVPSIESVIKRPGNVSLLYADLVQILHSGLFCYNTIL